MMSSPLDGVLGFVESKEALAASAGVDGSAHRGQGTWGKGGKVGGSLGWIQTGWPWTHLECPW